jgi:hypothetical protein
MKLAFLAKSDNWGSMPFYFNISSPVGKGYPNAPFEDVAFVQFCFAAIASNTVQETPSNLKEPWSKVKVTGHMDQVTQDGIDAWQQDRRKRFGSVFEDDGIFSVAPPTRSNYAKETPYAIVGVNYILMMCTPSLWPRLDKHPLAAPVAGAIRKAMTPELTA